jgi:hypothetical protein
VDLVLGLVKLLFLRILMDLIQNNDSARQYVPLGITPHRRFVRRAELGSEVREIEPFDRNLIQALQWNDEKVAIQSEYWKPGEQPENGCQSIHEFIEKILSKQENSVVFYDHRTGEIADFVVLNESGSKVTLSLYHCKASGGKDAGDRVGDVYEVCSQVVKSFNLIDNEKDLIRHIRRRALSGSRFVKGDVATFENIVRNRGPRPLEYQFVVVQPGISKNGLGEDSAAILAAAHEYVRNIGAKDLVVFASE